MTSGITTVDAIAAGRAALQRGAWAEAGAGFEDVKVERVPADFINSYYVAQKA